MKDDTELMEDMIKNVLSDNMIKNGLENMIDENAVLKIEIGEDKEDNLPDKKEEKCNEF